MNTTDPESHSGPSSAATQDPETGIAAVDGRGAAPAEESGSGQDWRWWVAIGCALAFLVGAAGFFIGTRNADSAASLDAVDIGFLQDMSDHHDQAIEQSLLALAHATDPTTRHFATETVLFQRYQLGQMAELLANDGLTRADQDRVVMQWMGMPLAFEDMPGLASPEEMDDLAAARGDEANRQFLELMRAHHEGGIHMAQFAADNANTPRVRALAAAMARNQEIEVREYTALLERLGFE